MRVRALTIPGSYEFTPIVHADDRGSFAETYRFEALSEVLGRPFVLGQANTSVSAAGVVRGVHYALLPPGQAKYVTAAHGALLDIVVDLRVGSPTFGGVDTVELDDVSRRAVFLSEGLGHVLVARTDGATASYLSNEVFNPERELTINPLDPELALPLPFPRHELVLSPRDVAAPSLAEARERGLLPTWDQYLEIVGTTVEGARS
jgi:dTDP-4-dehydrorhamnose 3,5-epimerase